MAELSLKRNGLTQIPAQIQLFSQLQTFAVSENNIPFVGNGSLSFSIPNLQYLDLSRNGLNTIESNAFQGISLIYLFLLSFKSSFSLHHCKKKIILLR